MTLTFLDYNPPRKTPIDQEIVDLLLAMDATTMSPHDIEPWLASVYPQSSIAQRLSLIRLVVNAPDDRDYDAALRHALSLDIETDGGVWGELPEPGTQRIFEVYQIYPTGLWSVLPDAALDDILTQSTHHEFIRLSALLSVLAPHPRRPSRWQRD